MWSQQKNYAEGKKKNPALCQLVVPERRENKAVWSVHPPGEPPSQEPAEEEEEEEEEEDGTGGEEGRGGDRGVVTAAREGSPCPGGEK